MKTLIVDDSVVSLARVRDAIESFSECVTAQDGEAAVALFKAHLEEGQHFDLICLDISMPKMSGQEALKTIRAIEDARGIKGLDGVKIIMVTAMDDPSSVLQSFREGCEAYITKPFQKEQLVAELRKLMPQTF